MKAAPQHNLSKEEIGNGRVQLGLWASLSGVGVLARGREALLQRYRSG